MAVGGIPKVDSGSKLGLGSIIRGEKLGKNSIVLVLSKGIFLFFIMVTSTCWIVLDQLQAMALVRWNMSFCPKCNYASLLVRGVGSPCHTSLTHLYQDRKPENLHIAKNRAL